MSKFIIGTVAVSLSSITYANDSYIGHFKTVSESSCNHEIILASGGEGEFLQTCRREDGSGIDDVERQSISWSSSGVTITVTVADGKQQFEYKDSLACSSFGSDGETNGLVSKRMKFWRAPINCN